MYKVKPVLIKKDISLFLVLSLCIVLIVNFYFLFQYKNKTDQLMLSYSELIENKDKKNDLSFYENQSLDFYKEIDQIMAKKEIGISIEKISLTPKLIVVYGNSTNMNYINIFKANVKEKYTLKKVNKQKDLYYFELEKKNE
ncbi:hypothetical protein ODQ17_13090 [Acinetobacter sp. IRS14]|uniref:hypothetical protein n=1 Tax=Acinetobacter sp. IRS14 TaxID=2983398 RepID=UPI002AFE6B28|nr:hypothetical protein [Acinetobacter sp. IRS14]MEA1230304.1 hypothetical protein [Acinetobacter sp. IRS14]